jgi:SynChlorMet cassette radical SAM/SPASM protein ScmF
MKWQLQVSSGPWKKRPVNHKETMSCDTVKTSLQPSDQAAHESVLLDGVPPLNSLYLYISASCNLACRHCWISPMHHSVENGGKPIRVDYVQKATREAKPLGLRTVKLTGGEPMLHPRFREIVRLIDDEGVQIHIETNGTLIDNHLAKFLKQTEHVSFISVSLDGANEETHENLRRVSGSFERAITGIKNLLDWGLQPQLICTLHQGNVSQAGEIIELAEKLGCHSIKFNRIQPLGRGEHFAKEKGSKLPEILNLYHHIENDLIPKSKIRIHLDIPFAFYSIRKLLDDDLSRCTVTNILGVLADGELSLCGIGVMVPELIYGHIERDRLRDVWCHSPGLVQLRAQIPGQLKGICGHCIHRDFCLAACVANNYHVTGTLTAPYEFCHIADKLGLFPASRKRKSSG